MQVLAILFVAVGVVAAGSGPYLPSGWKPSGPAFLLPGENEKPAEIQELLQEEAAGSDSLREYGPPKLTEVSQDITQQALPDVETELPFAAINLKALPEEATEATFEETTPRETESESNAEISEEPKAELLEQPKEELSTTEVAQAENDKANSDVVQAFEEREGKSLETAQVEETEDKETEEVREPEVKSIADALANLEDEPKNTQQSQTEQVEPETQSIETVNTSSAKVPEEFLEYGPPGFREYGPPKEQSTAEINEVRRRRFSPKFRAAAQRL